MELNPLIASSVDKTKLSATIEGLIPMLAGLTLALAQYLEVPITEGDIMLFISSIMIAIGALRSAFGVMRKVYVWAVSLTN